MTINEFITTYHISNTLADELREHFSGVVFASMPAMVAEVKEYLEK